MISRVFFFLVVGLAIASSSPASAGWVMEQTTRAGTGSGRERILIQANHLKTVMLGASGAPESAVILDLDADTITHVDFAQRTYFTATSDEYARAMTASMGAATEALAGMRDALKDLPPEQRQMMEQMLAARAPGAACRPPAVEVRRGGQTATIAGYPAVRYEVVVDGKPGSDVWVAPGIGAWRELDGRKLERMMRALTSAAGCAGAGVRAEDVGWRVASEGYPVRITSRNGNGGVEVIRAQSQAVPAGEFEAPSGFVRKSMREVFGR